MKNRAKKIIEKTLLLLDLKLVRASASMPKDLTALDINPLACQYYTGVKPVLISIDLSSGRSNRWFDLSSRSIDPAVLAIKTSLRKGLAGESLCQGILDILKEHDELVGSSNAADQLGLSLDSSPLNGYPAWAAVNPWDSQSIADKYSSFPQSVKVNRAANGLLIDTNDPQEIMNINSNFSLPSHAKQYAILAEQLLNNGFRYGGNYGYVTAELLIKDGQVRWKPGDEGNHRIVVASALGFESIPVLVTKIIRFDEWQEWPNVVAGAFSGNEALAIFEKIFHAKPPGFQDPWLIRCSASGDC